MTQSQAEMEKQAREFWETLPHCKGYPACDAQLEGYSHEPGCPLFGKGELSIFEFAASFAAQVRAQVREQTIEECAHIAGGADGEGNTPEQCEGYTDACLDIQKEIRELAAPPVTSQGQGE